MAKFSPSILASDFSNLRQEIKKIDKATYLHIDVMDGMFVPNITLGPGIINSIRPYSDLIFDTHLMIEKPERYIQEFSEAGSDIITLHVEATKHLHRAIQQVKNIGCKAGVALNPATPLQEIEYVLPELDLVLIMSVNPGFGGQSLIPQTLDKIRKLNKIIRNKNLDIEIEIDGGVNKYNCQEVVAAGTDIIVAGSAIFKQPDPAQTLAGFQELVKEG